MISMDKKYKYRNGQPARILCVDRKEFNANHVYPVISLGQDGALRYHHYDGVRPGDCSWDLFEVKPKTKVDFWINIYPTYRGTMHDTEAAARCMADEGVIARLHFEAEVEEGQGL
jgi:hypothetical protein